MKYDALVVGGGPTGSQVAYQLAKLGYRIALLERQPGIGGKPACTGIVGQECLKSFAISRDVVLRPANSALLFAPSGRSLGLHRDEPQAYVLDRTAFNRLMAQRALELGVEYHLNTTVESVKNTGEVVIAKSSQGKFEARAAVIAAGFGSRLTDGMGKFEDFAAGVQAEVDSTVTEIEVYLGRETAPGFFAWLVPTSPGKARVGLLTRKNPTFYLKELLNLLTSQGKIASAEVEFNHSAVPLKPLPQTYDDRILVVGDAAGHVKPTTGGGIYYGLLGADIATRTLHQALQSNDLSVKNLAAYEREWKRLLGSELRIGYWARKLFEKLGDSQIDRVFEVVKRNRIDETLLKSDDLAFDWHSRAILSLLRQQVVTSVINVWRFPTQLTGDGRKV